MKYLYSVFCASVLSLLAGSAIAHHPLAGAPMTTYFQGFVSGVGHPILGFDHLFFILAVGVAAVFTSRNLMAPLFFVGGMLFGVGVIVVGVQLPMVELMVSLSLVVLGGIVLAGKALSYSSAVGLFVVLGIFHGWAFGETLVGREGGLSVSVLVGYLIGLALTQWLIAVSAGYFVLKVWQTRSSTAIKPRLVGAVVAGVGAAFTLEIAETLLFGIITTGV